MKFSIITPNHNGANYIEACIKSVLSQNVDFEHIIIDDCSTDSSLEILKKYPHLRIISENDNGMYDAINKGLSICIITSLIATIQIPDSIKPTKAA